MENGYELTFFDLKYFNHISQFTKDTFKFWDEIKKLRKPYLNEERVKDSIPEYKNYPESKDLTGDEIGKQLQIPQQSTELLKYIGKCDGRISFLYQVDKFLEKYSSFQDTFLKVWLVDIEKKESLSKGDECINESFELTKWPSLNSKRELKSEHYYCRLRNNFYSIHPDELLNDYGHLDSKIVNEFGIIMFYEFAKFLLLKSDDKPKNDKIETDAIQVFQNDGYKLFKYLEKKYTRDDRTLPVKYSNLYHFLKYNQLIRGTQKQYLTFIEENRQVKISKVQPQTYKYTENIQPLLNDLFKNNLNEVN